MATIVNVTPSQDLQTAINACVSPSASNIYDLMLAPGTIANPNVWNVMNLITRDYVNLKSADADRRKVWIKGERANGSSNCGAYETITYKTTTVFENLTITCKNMRYPYHNDGCAPNTQQIVNNCHIEHLGNWRADGITPAPYAESGWDSCHANGCGTSSGMTVTINNSHLIARQNGIALYAHDAVGFTQPSSIIANNNILEHADNGPTVWMDGGANSGQSDLCVLNNNVMIGGGIWSHRWLFSGEGNTYDFFYNSYDQPQYIYFGDEHYRHLTNNSGGTIYKGMACAFNGDMYNVRLMTSNDSISSFAGIASFDISNGSLGHFAFTAKILERDLVLPSELVVGDRLGIDPATPGRLIKNSLKYVVIYESDWIWYGANKGKLFKVLDVVSSNEYMSVKIGGNWRSTGDIFIKIGGSWRNASDIFVKHGGSWRTNK